MVIAPSAGAVKQAALVPLTVYAIARLAPTVEPVTVKEMLVTLVNDNEVGEKVKPPAGVGVMITSVAGSAVMVIETLELAVATTVSG